jgi:hypothetical protein
MKITGAGAMKDICGNCHKVILEGQKTIQGGLGVYHDYCPEPDIPEITAITHVRVGDRRRCTNVAYANGVTLRFTSKLTVRDATVQANRMYHAFLAVGWTREEILRAFPDDQPMSTAFATVRAYQLARRGR